jgi:hypothetical protein
VYFLGRVFEGMIGYQVNTKSPLNPKLLGGGNTRKLNKA